MSKQIETRATSRRTAICNPIVLREGAQVRLVFVPTIVDNLEDPNSCIDGQFVYERKARSERWIPIATKSLSTTKEGEEFKLTLHAKELRTLLEGLVPLYRLHRAQGVPRSSKTFVEVDRGIAKFISEGGEELTSFVHSQQEDATKLLLKFINWVSTSSSRTNIVERLSSVTPEHMPAFTALLGLAAIKGALAYWKEHKTEASEEFWQKTLSERAYVLSQVFAYPVVIIGTKVYVGGKAIDRAGGKEADFLLAAESTDAVILVEIKTPQTKLLGPEYRGGVFPFSRELSSAVAQILRYRQTFTRSFDSLNAESLTRLTLGETRCVVVSGQSSELSTQTMRENFELQRERTRGVTVITFDELFLRMERLVSLLEGRLTE